MKNFVFIFAVLLSSGFALADNAKAVKDCQKKLDDKLMSVVFEQLTETNFGIDGLSKELEADNDTMTRITYNNVRAIVHNLCNDLNRP